MAKTTTPKKTTPKKTTPTSSSAAITNTVAAAAKPKPAARKKAAPATTGAVKKESSVSIKKPKAAVQAQTNGKAKDSPAAKEKTRKPKLVRDSFTMPEAEYQVLGEVKKACLKAGIAVKKSELLRVGVALLRQLDTGRLKEVLDALPPLKAGRPKKEK